VDVRRGDHTTRRTGRVKTTRRAAAASAADLALAAGNASDPASTSSSATTPSFAFTAGTRTSSKGSRSNIAAACSPESRRRRQHTAGSGEVAGRAWQMSPKHVVDFRHPFRTRVS
jgi:hypothetical protein